MNSDEVNITVPCSVCHQKVTVIFPCYKSRFEEIKQENAELKQLIKEQEEMSCKIWVKIPNLIEQFNKHGEDYKSAIKELLSELYLFEAAKWVRDL